MPYRDGRTRIRAVAVLVAAGSRRVSTTRYSPSSWEPLGWIFAFNWNGGVVVTSPEIPAAVGSGDALDLVVAEEAAGRVEAGDERTQVQAERLGRDGHAGRGEGGLRGRGVLLADQPFDRPPVE